MEEELAKFRAEKHKIEQENGLSTRLTSLFSFRSTSRNEIDPKSKAVQLSEPRRYVEEVTSHPTVTSSSISRYDNCLRWTSLVLKCLLWFILMFLFVKLEFGAVFFISSLLYFICTNLRTKPKAEGELSAYSVFNPNFERLDGTLTADQFEREIRFGAAAVH